jgi:AmmeMemoRadiSam system protein A
MPGSKLSGEEQKQLLDLARRAITDIVTEKSISKPNIEDLPPSLQEYGATFVTLTIRGELRGCIGTLESKKSLAEDVVEHAVAAAIHDYRFPPLRAEELDDINIEISRLTKPEPLIYKDADDLLSKLRPGVDGVIMQYGPRRATFLPQVWEKLPDPVDFLDHLCFKMGVPTDLWRKKRVEIQIYQVDEFHEQVS